MQYTHSTHLADFGTDKATELVIVCGNYYRRLRSYAFSKEVKLAPWSRIREGVNLIHCIEPIVEVAPDRDQYSYAAIMQG